MDMRNVFKIQQLPLNLRFLGFQMSSTIKLGIQWDRCNSRLSFLSAIVEGLPIFSAARLRSGVARNS